MSESSYAKKVSACKHRLWRSNKPVLGQLDAELTERCNNNCIHCCINLPIDDVKAKQGELTTLEWKRILSEAAALGALKVRFTGGEPLLREDFMELYVYARRLGLKVLLFTNARLITPDLADLFVRIPPIENIEVTVYGMSRESYEQVTRIKGSYEEFRRGTELLLEYKIPFIVKGVLLPPNQDEMEIFEDWASKIPWMNKQRPNYVVFLDFRGRRDTITKNSFIQGLRISPEEVISFFTRHREEYIREMRVFCSKFMRPPGQKLFSCGTGHSVCADAYGNLQYCLSLRHPNTIYSLRSGSLQDALKSFFPSLRDILATNPDYLAHCAKCFLKGLCQQCPAKSWAEHGSLDTPVEYLCRAAHVQARDLGVLREEELAWEIENWRERIGWI